jgi:uncharacterized protein YggE
MNDPIFSASRPYLAAVVVLGLFYLAGQYIGSNQRVATAPDATRQIEVQGSGEVHVQPDIAKVTVGVTTGSQPSAKAALDILSQKFSKVVASVKANGVKDEDIKTANLNINPSYDFTNGQQSIKGYEASESIEIKIRNLDKTGDIVAAATAQGANQVGGVMFDVADPDKINEQAQSKAIEDARAKAQKLARELGVSLGRVKTFSANSSQPYPIPYAMEAKQVGGGAPDQATPPVPSGTFDVTTRVTIIYEIN